MGKKSYSWFVIGIIYILVWEAICCFSYSLKEIEREKQIYKDLSKTIFQNLEALSNSGGDDGDLDGSGNNGIQDDTIYIDKFEQQDNSNTKTKSNSNNRNNNNHNSIKSSPITTVASRIGKGLEQLLPPLNLTFDVKNSSMNIPTYVQTDSFSLSDININSTNFGLQSENIKLNISVTAEQFPISMNLLSNKSDVPISLGIYGANNIPVNLIVSSLETPALNYIVIIGFASINFILVIFVVTQQISICRLKKRLDAIDISDQVLKGKRFKKGGVWYSSINNSDFGNNSNSSNNDSSIDFSDRQQDQQQLQQDQQQQTYNPMSIISCGKCGQINGKTRFCFNCGNGLM